jgi:hypothetical protein
MSPVLVAVLCRELRRRVQHLHERLAGADRPRRFHNATVVHLNEFLADCQALNLPSAVRDLVRWLAELLEFLTPGDLREHRLLRQQVAQRLAQVQDQLVAWLDPGTSLPASAKPPIGDAPCTDCASTAVPIRHPRPTPTC